MELRLKLVPVQVVREGEVESVEAGEQGRLEHERLEQVRVGTCRVVAD